VSIAVLSNLCLWLGIAIGVTLMIFAQKLDRILKARKGD